jgi:metal transporter CNNM
MALYTYLVVVILVLLSGLFSGLTLGLLSLSPYDLRRKMKLGNMDAKKIYPLRKRGNLLLCTLLLGNVAVNSALAVFLGSIASGFMAGLIATGLIVIFGEIVPQAVFSRFALKFGAKTVWIVYLFMFILYPICKPISYVLDKALGSELPTVYSHGEFRELLEEQRDLKGSAINHREFKILEGGLDISKTNVGEVMTPRVNVFFLNQDDLFTRKVMNEIRKSGFSRIPVFRGDKDKIAGVLYVKDLVGVSSLSKKTVKSMMQKGVSYVKIKDHLGLVLDKFRKKKVHIFVVKDEFKGVAGIVTLEDVLEEVVGEIVDEYDSFVDMRKLK